MREARKWLKDLRIQNDLTQAQLGERIGMSQQAVNFFENGQRDPTPKTAQKIADLLGFNWVKFFEDIEDS